MRRLNRKVVGVKVSEGYHLFVGMMIVSSALIFTPSYSTQSKICGDGTVLIGDTCQVDLGQNDGWVEVSIDFNTSILRINKGDKVRMYFNSTDWSHYVPETFVIPHYGINEFDMTDQESRVVEFIATDEGVYQYFSEGLCRVDIPGAGTVDVDCSIFCGETENGRNGYIVVEGESKYTISKSAWEIGIDVCELIEEYCNEEE